MLTPTIVHYFCGIPPLAESSYQDLNEYIEVIMAYDTDFLLKKKKNNIIIVEHRDNHFDGLQCIQMIRKKDQEIPIIFLAKEPSKLTIINAIRLGASDVFLLPIVKEELISCIYQLVEKNRQNHFKYFVNKLLEIKSFLFSKNKKLSPKSNYGKDVMYSSVLFPIPMIQKENNHQQVLQVKTLDDFEIRQNNKVLNPLKSKRATALLCYLIFYRKKKINKHILMSTFWRDSNKESAKNCLHVTIHHLRKYFIKEFPDTDIIIYENDKYGVNPEIVFKIDTDDFLDTWKKGKFIEENQGLEAACEWYQKAYMIYQKDFLEQISEESWVELERENLREIFLAILGKLSLYYFQQGKYMVALQVCKEALKKDNCLEEVHRRMMACYYSLKMRDKAIRQFYKCEKIIKEELEIQPSTTTVELFKKIRKYG